LPSYFAGKGCRVVASDIALNNVNQAVWSKTGQHAASKESLYKKDLVSKEQFDKLVSYRDSDMNFIDPDLSRSYDFVWSTCSLEHVGSISLGQRYIAFLILILRFIINSLDLLKAGGVAVHTMEFTLSSLDNTIETGGTVLWRKQDIEQLVSDLKILGYKIFPIHWGAGMGPLDLTPDVSPYSQDQHIKLDLAGHAATSFAIIIQKPEGDATQFGGIYAKP
jgi:hypothetical protein